MRQNLLFEKTSKFDKVNENKREKTKLNKTRVEKGDIATNSSEIYRNIMEYFENSLLL
jgi:hypothetical protein